MARRMTREEFKSLNAFAKTKGFRNLREMDDMMQRVDRTLPDFKEWAEKDRTKAGLEEIITRL